MADQHPLGREAEGGHIPRAVEPVAEALEARDGLGRIEAQHEARGRVAHAGEDPVHPRREEVHAAVGHAGGEQGHDLAIGARGVAEGKADRVQVGAGGPVELAVEPLERLLEPGRCSHPRGLILARSLVRSRRRLLSSPRRARGGKDKGMLKVGIVGMGVIGRRSRTR